MPLGALGRPRKTGASQRDRHPRPSRGVGRDSCPGARAPGGCGPAAPLRAGPFGVTQTEPGSTGVPERGCDDGPSSLSPAASPGGAGFGTSGESGDGGWFAPELPR